jgi:hypothetical protein
MKRLALAIVCVFALGAAATGCVAEDSTLTIDNQSDYALHSLYVAPIDAIDWGPDLLGGDVLLPGEYMTVGLDCDTYDVLISDELGATCELNSLDLCFDDADWVITNSQLAVCSW